MNLPVSIASRAALYLRVSTTRQAEVDLSIPDQRSQTKAYCERQGWQVVADYIEPGASAMDDQRPEFQRMIERASDDDRPFDVIVVHSFSRFFRDAFGLEMYIRRLAKHGVRLVSITQELGDDPSQVMMRQVIALFDEYQSRENAKHVLRAMKENARQGFYNGSRVPLGYAVEDVEKRGHRTKKRLIIDPVEAETVRLIFKLYLEGDGASGPLGVKEVAKALNTRGIRTRLGARFGVGPVHLILTNPLYIGEWRFNRRHAKTGQEKPVAEVIAVEVPPIIERETFDQVRRSLKARNPRSMPPRITTGPILLTGLAYCASCSSAMTLRTGTSKTGRVYRYYSCSGAARMGKTACKGRSIPMDRLDQLVTGHIADYLLVADRIADLLAEIVKSRAMAGGEVRDRIDQLSRQASIADDKLRRLYALVEDGVTDLDEVLKIRLADIKADRDQARSALDRIKGQSPAARIDRAKIERFGSLMRQSITTGDIPFRKAYLRSFIDAIEVDDRVIRIHGSKSSLEQAVIASSQAGKNGVRSFVRKWRSLGESNPCFSLERAGYFLFCSLHLFAIISFYQLLKRRSFAFVRPCAPVLIQQIFDDSKIECHDKNTH